MTTVQPTAAPPERYSAPWRLLNDQMKPLSTTPSRTHAVTAAVLVTLLAVALTFAIRGTDATAKGNSGLPKPPPNIVLFLTDDQPASTVLPENMPNTYDLLISQGTTFSDYVAVTPLCCPSRAAILTGQYGHNNGVLRNFYGDLREKRNVLPAWLQQAGYTTAHVGKWLNAYERYASSPTDVPPGWDLWFSQLEPRKYYDYNVSFNGDLVRYGGEDADHLTEVMNRRAGIWTNKFVRRPEPFYLQYDFYAPHGAQGRDPRCIGGPVPAPRDEHHFDALPLPMPPSFNEADVSDKPASARSRPLMDQPTIDNVARRYRCTMESMLSVDRGIRKVYDKVARAGELNNTVFILSSDNGYFFGEHRIPKGKPDPYEENIRMPFTILVPPALRDHAPQVPTSDAPVANIDVNPTILDLAGAQPCRKPGVCRVQDGRSLMPLLDGTGGWPDPRSFVIELNSCTYRGIRSDHNVYFEYGSGPIPVTGGCRPTDIEHYNLDADPYQLDNLFPAGRRTDNGMLELKLAKRMVELSDCAGIEGRDPAPASGHYCE